MRGRTRRSMPVLAIILALVLAGVPSAVGAGDITLRYANFPPAPTFPCVQMERWKTEVEKRTAGRVTVNTFSGGTLLGAKEMMDGVIAGQADIGCLCMAYQPGRFVVTNATGLPLGIADARTGSLVLLDLYNKYKPEAFAAVKVLAMFTTAQSNIMSQVPVRRLEDLPGLSLRGSGPAAQVLGLLGANPVGMPMSDVPESLQKGVIKGLLSSLEVLKDFKFAETCRFVTMIDTVIYPFAVVMNIDRWKALPADVQKVLDDLVAEQSEWTGVYMDNHVKESVAWSKETYQVEFIELPADEKARWDGRLKPITAKWAADAKAKGLPADAILADIRASLARHAK